MREETTDRGDLRHQENLTGPTKDIPQQSMFTYESRILTVVINNRIPIVAYLVNVHRR